MALNTARIASNTIDDRTGSGTIRTTLVCPYGDDPAKQPNVAGRSSGEDGGRFADFALPLFDHLDVVDIGYNCTPCRR